MLHGLLDIDSFGRVKFNHFSDEIQRSLWYHNGETTLSKLLKNYSGGVGLKRGKVGLKSGRSTIPGHSFAVGVPWYWKILNIWSISLSPQNKPRFSTISVKIHPTDQISTPNEYCFYESSISGALYHRVSTSWVRVLIGTPKALASPKSAILIMPVALSISIFCGFKSLWMILLEWQ